MQTQKDLQQPALYPAWHWVSCPASDDVLADYMQKVGESQEELSAETDCEFASEIKRFDHRLCHRALHLSQLFSRAWDLSDPEQSAAAGIIHCLALGYAQRAGLWLGRRC